MNILYEVKSNRWLIFATQVNSAWPSLCVGRCSEYQWKPGSKQTHSAISMVWQCKLVSGWRLMKRRSVPPYGPYDSESTLFSLWHLLPCCSCAQGVCASISWSQWRVEAKDASSWVDFRGKWSDIQSCWCRSVQLSISLRFKLSSS